MSETDQDLEYDRVNWKNNITEIDEDNLNKMDAGIARWFEELKNIKKNLTKREFLNIMRMMSNFCNGVKKTPKNRTFGASCGTDTHSVRNSIIFENQHRKQGGVLL